MDQVLAWLGENYIELFALITGVGGAITSIASIIKVFKSDKENKQDIKITREGIIEAFKKAKLPTDLRVSLTKQVDEKLNAMSDKLLAEVKEREAKVTKLAAYACKILANTAAFNKLSVEEQADINECISELLGEQYTIDISE